jgi:hypothetical protein
MAVNTVWIPRTNLGMTWWLEPTFPVGFLSAREAARRSWPR